MTKTKSKERKTGSGELRRCVPAICGVVGFLLGCLLCFCLRDKLSGVPASYRSAPFENAAFLFDALGRQLVFFVLTSLSALSAYALLLPSFLLFLRAAEAAFAACSMFRLHVPPFYAVLGTLTGIGICALLCASAHLCDCFYRNVRQKNAVMITDYVLRQLYLIGCASALFLTRAALLTLYHP